MSAVTRRRMLPLILSACLVCTTPGFVVAVPLGDDPVATPVARDSAARNSAARNSVARNSTARNSAARNSAARNSAAGEWVPLHGPSGGSLRVLRFTAWGTWYAAGEGGVYVSVTDGRSWTGMRMLPQWYNSLLSLVPVSPELLCISTDKGVWRTRNGGANWEEMRLGIQRMELDSSGTLCALIDNSVHVSYDTGRTWEGPTLPASGVHAVAVYQLYAPAPGMMLALSRARIYRSTDGGCSWDSLSLPFSGRTGYDGGYLFGDASTLGIAILPNSTEAIWVYLSHDLGRTWTELRYPSVPFGMVTAYAARGTDLVLVERQSAECRTVVHHTSDEGRSWTAVPSLEYSVMSATIRPDRDLFLSSWDRLLHLRMSDGQSTDVSEGLETSVIRSLHAFTDSIVIAGAFSRMSRSADAGASWSTVAAIPGCRWFGEQMVRLRDGSVYTLGSDESLLPMLLHTADSGATWQSACLPRHDRAPELLASDGDSVLLAAYSGGDIACSTDPCAAWTTFSYPDRSESIQALAVDGGGRIFAGQRGSLWYTDDRSRWKAVTEGLPSPLTVEQLLVDRVHGRIVANAGYDGLFISTDRGLRWERRTAGFMKSKVNAVVIDARGRLYAMDSEYAYTLDSMTSRWRVITRRPVPMAVRAMAAAPSGRLFTGTQYFGVWMLEQPDADTSESPPAVITGFRLLSIHPNPSKTGTGTLTFEIDRPAAVGIELTDQLGRRVYTATVQCAAAGRQIHTLGARRLAAGTYHCTITDGSRSAYGRLVLF